MFGIIAPRRSLTWEHLILLLRPLPEDTIPVIRGATGDLIVDIPMRYTTAGLMSRPLSLLGASPE